jgi:SPP1 family predicted phage head-tail adaptor
MRAGQLDKRVTIEQPPDPDVTDEAGQPSGSWTTFLGPTYASIKSQSGREVIAGGAAQSGVTHIVTIRYRADKRPTAKMRVKYGTRYFMIKAVRDLDFGSVILELDCEEGLRDGN